MMARDLKLLPKAHLHLHLTGSMRPDTLKLLAERNGVALPHGVIDQTDSSRHVGWPTFQARYDAARAVLRTGDDIRQVIHEAALDDAADGSLWLEIQCDPTSYVRIFGSLRGAIEALLRAAHDASRMTGIGVGVIVSASWARPPQQATELARLAAEYVNDGVVGFGLSNDERLGDIDRFVVSLRSAREAGLLVVPHSGFFHDAWHVAKCVESGAHRIGHGIRAAADPQVLRLIASHGVTLEICPSSYAPLGVIDSPNHLPLRRLYEAGVSTALGADDPLLLGSGLADQYALAREVLGFNDHELAQLARYSLQASAAPDHLKNQVLAQVNAWLINPAPLSSGPGPHF